MLKAYRLFPNEILIRCGRSTTGGAGGPPSAKPGSPGFFWAVARESYRTGDFVKTDSTLRELARGSSEYAGKARLWHLVVSAGLAKAFRGWQTRTKPEPI